MSPTKPYESGQLAYRPLNFTRVKRCGAGSTFAGCGQVFHASTGTKQHCEVCRATPEWAAWREERERANARRWYRKTKGNG